MPLSLEDTLVRRHHALLTPSCANHSDGVMTPHRSAAIYRGTETVRASPHLPRLRHEFARSTSRCYAAIAATPTPTLDRVSPTVSRAADHSSCGRRGGAGAQQTASASTGSRRSRSHRPSSTSAYSRWGAGAGPTAPRMRCRSLGTSTMPSTTSFPSGHAASAFAFATGVTRELPTVGIPMHGAAAVVAYSRVHTGVRYPLDVIVGAVVGGALSPLATTWLDRRRARRGC